MPQPTPRGAAAGGTDECYCSAAMLNKAFTINLWKDCRIVNRAIASTDARQARLPPLNRLRTSGRHVAEQIERLVRRSRRRDRPGGDGRSTVGSGCRRIRGRRAPQIGDDRRHRRRVASAGSPPLWNSERNAGSAPATPGRGRRRRANALVSAGGVGRPWRLARHGRGRRGVGSDGRSARRSASTLARATW